MPVTPHPTESPAYRKQRASHGGHGYSVSVILTPTQHRDVDALSPFWSLPDLTPESRGDFMPKRSFSRVMTGGDP